MALIRPDVVCLREPAATQKAFPGVAVRAAKLNGEAAWSAYLERRGYPGPHAFDPDTPRIAGERAGLIGALHQSAGRWDAGRLPLRGQRQPAATA